MPFSKINTKKLIEEKRQNSEFEAAYRAVCEKYAKKKAEQKAKEKEKQATDSE